MYTMKGKGEKGKREWEYMAQEGTHPEFQADFYTRYPTGYEEVKGNHWGAKQSKGIQTKEQRQKEYEKDPTHHYGEQSSQWGQLQHQGEWGQDSEEGKRQTTEEYQQKWKPKSWKNEEQQQQQIQMKEESEYMRKQREYIQMEEWIKEQRDREREKHLEFITDQSPQYKGKKLKTHRRWYTNLHSMMRKK